MLDLVLQAVMGVGLASNLIALCVILRQGIRQPDLKLALMMAMCDFVLASYKLGEAGWFYSTGDTPSGAGSSIGQWKGVLTTFLLQLSAVSVGFLALLRFWVIYLKQKMVARVWWTMFIVPQVMMLGLLVAVACLGQFEGAQNLHQFYPKNKSGNWVVELCRTQLLFSFVWPVVAVNISYPCIARTYEYDIYLLHPREMVYKQTRLIYTKIASFVLTYNLVMLPSLIVLILEEATGELQSEALETFAVIALFSITVFNPLVLITLHHDTFRELKTFLRQIKSILNP